MIIHPNDNVEIHSDGHKYARRAIAKDEKIIKYGMVIGHATAVIEQGERVHTNNLASDLGDLLAYEYQPDFTDPIPYEAPTFMGYRRADGKVGIRNDIWIIPTVGCVNSLCTHLADKYNGIALTHPYGCSQLGEDHQQTANLLAALAKHPNAGGVLVVGLGCENNTLESFKERIGDLLALNIRFLVTQQVADEFQEGCKLIEELLQARNEERAPISASELIVGLKCGGSDGLSGLTANPLVGRFSDWLVARGGSVVLAEVPEMFGAETLLMKRCRTRDIFDRYVKMINDFKSYFIRHHQAVDRNPSPGNQAGGITTLEEKSLGCVQKGGTSPVEDVLPYTHTVQKRGLSLLCTPGNDLVSSTGLAAAGCHLILFTTGRGTPFGSVVPTIKIATQTQLAERKSNWIDWDAMGCPDVNAFAQKCIQVAGGDLTKSEINRSQEIAIWKQGVTL